MAKEHRRPPEERALHILMPYVLGILALFLILCFLFGDEKLGYFGKISVLFKGLFSVGAYAMPALLLVHAFFYKRDLLAGSYLYKFWFSFGDMTLIGVLAALLEKRTPAFDWKGNFAAGVLGLGGGVAGGFCHALLQMTVGLFTPVITVLGLILFTSFLFGTTPADLIRSLLLPLGDKMRADRAQRKERQSREREGKEKIAAAREEERLRLAEMRAREKYRVKEEAKALRRDAKEKAKCAANLESGEEVTSPAPPDHIEDDELRIRLPLEKEREKAAAEPPAEEKKEIYPIEEVPSEPAPSLHEELQSIFASEMPPVLSDLPELSPEETVAEADLVTEPADEDTPPWEESAPPAKAEEAPTLSASKIEPEEEAEEPELPEYRFPPLSLLHAAPAPQEGSHSEQEQTAKKLVDTLASFGVKTGICGIAKGPAVTRYELQPQPGVRVRSIVNLTDDIALALAAGGVRIEAPIPGKEAVGIEVPNRARETVYVRELIEQNEFGKNPSRLHCCLGKDVGGKPVFCDLSKMPHILIAGATGMGKSVCLNSLIVSILYHATPEEVQMILIDPKKVEMGVYNRIPHLLVPVVSDSKKAAGALNWAVIEMEKRFIEMEEVGVRDIKHYNDLTRGDPEKRQMSQIVIIIDELADLMMTARDEVETSICRLAQKARAAGMHLVIGTQRPSVDVITGLIKANVPSRIACTVASQVDSRTIIDIQGAEKLLGRGDMLYAPVGSPKPLRVQGCFVSEQEIEAVCDFIRAQREAHYDEAVSNLIEREAQKCGEKKKGGLFASEGSEDPTAIGLFADKDPLLEKAIDVAVTEKKVSTSLLQRKLSVGYARAAKLIDYMAEMNVVGPYAGSKPREVLWTEQYLAEYKMRALEESPIQ
ncbi:MAG: DNA translocase FtsK [Clostridia bacterium]|nr:DNA translocase FtsK [Clostridia bacterium]